MTKLFLCFIVGISLMLFSNPTQGSEELEGILEIADDSESIATQARVLHEALLAEDYLLVMSTAREPGFDARVLNYQRPEDGNSLLHLAVESASMDMLSKLTLLPNININLVNQARRTPLHTAIAGDDELKALVLINAGADIFIPSDMGSSLLMAKVLGRESILKQLRSRATGVRMGDAPGTRRIH